MALDTGLIPAQLAAFLQQQRDFGRAFDFVLVSASNGSCWAKFDTTIALFVFCLFKALYSALKLSFDELKATLTARL